MAKGLLLAWTTPVSAEQDSAFHSWYDDVHVPQVRKAVPAIAATYRYRQVDPAGGPMDVRYLCVYELDTDDVASAAADLGAASASGAIDMTETMDLSANPPIMQWLETL